MKILKKRRISESVKEDTLLEVDSKMETRIPHTVAEMLNSTKLKGSSSVIHVSVILLSYANSNIDKTQSTRFDLLECSAEALISCKGRRIFGAFGRYG